MATFVDDVLRKARVGVWSSMPINEEPEWSGKPHSRGLGRIDSSALWRVSSRKELVGYYKNVMKKVYKNLAIAVLFLAGALYSFSLYMQTRDIMFAVFAVVFAAFVSRHYTKAWGGFTGGWTDYECDPVQMVPHSSYVKNGWGLM